MPGRDPALRERAAALRAAGRTRAEIAGDLGVSLDAAKHLLRGVALPDPLRRARARDDLRAVAEEMRRRGATYDEIAADLGVSKASCSVWLRDVSSHPAGAAPPRATDCGHEDLAEREAERQAVREQALAGVGALSARELELVAVAAYWAEGTKSKPWNRRERLTFVNSDPGMVLLFCAWLDQLGVEPERRAYRLQIHESADRAAAEQWWASVLAVPLERFSRATLKRHRPVTVRKNTGEGYKGCLVVDVRRSKELYQRVEGVWQGIVAGLSPQLPEQDRSPVV